MKLVEITSEKYDVLLDIRYASTNNFTEGRVYKRAACYLNEEAEHLLCKSIELAKATGHRLKIFDGFRPMEAVQALWDHTPNADYLAPPSSGSPHARGAAIDLTLVNDQGNELEMGTEFDAMTGTSHHGALDIDAAAQINRSLLLGIMTSAGWDFYRNEWWHYQLFKPRRYPTLSDVAAQTNMMS